jgi:hypothetical protein
VPAPSAPATPTAAPSSPTATAGPTVAPPRLAASGFGQAGRALAFGFALENPNREVALEGVEYRAAALGPGGTVLGTADGRVPTLGAGERRGVAGSLELPAGATVESLRVELRPGRPALAAPSARPALRTEGVVWREEGGATRVIGTVVNPSGQGSGPVTVTALVLDRQGGIVGAGSARAAPLPPNGRATVEVPVVAGRAANEVELYATSE